MKRLIAGGVLVVAGVAHSAPAPNGATLLWLTGACIIAGWLMGQQHNTPRPS